MKTRRPTLYATLLLICIGSVILSSAHAAIYKYQREDGTWVYTDNPAEAPTDQEAGKKMEQMEDSERDLSARLEQHLPPANAIERAALATVTIQSEIGSGTGFFITAEGHILTNKHVIRSTQVQKESREEAYVQIEAKIDSLKTALEEEQERIALGASRLEAVRNQIHPADYELNRKKLDDWQADLERRREGLRKEIAEYRDQQQELENKIGATDLDSHFTITLADKTEFYVSLIAVSDEADLALLKLDGYRTPFLEPSIAGATGTGNPVFAIGNPVGLHNSVSSGVLSGYQGGFLQTDAKIYPGNSGGPLLNQDGRVMGVNTFKQITYKFEGLGFAIPIDTALREFDSYLAGYR